MSGQPESLRAVLTLAAAAAAGWVCDRAGLPLGWLVGPMLTVIVAELLDLRPVQPTLALPWVRSSVGTLLGAAVTWPVLAQVPGWWMTLAGMLAVMGLAMAINTRILRRRFGFPPLDAVLCASPGGIAEMILWSETAGADPRRVAIVHALRIALSILTIPVLMLMVFGVGIVGGSGPKVSAMSLPDWGWFALCVLSGVLATRIPRIPLPFITVPGLLCAGLHLGDVTHFAVPGVVSQIMQLVIGINVGGRFKGASLRALAPVFGAASLVFTVQMGCALAGVAVLAHLTRVDPLILTLAFAPGGLAEMSLIAIAVGRDVALVGLHHLVRVLAALAVTPVLLGRLSQGER